MLHFCNAVLRGTLRSWYVFKAAGKPFRLWTLERSIPSVAPSSSAEPAPCAMYGSIGWQASPRKTTVASSLYHLSNSSTARIH